MIWKPNGPRSVCSDPLWSWLLSLAYLHGFNVVAHVEVSIAELAVDGAEGSEVICSSLERI